MGALNKKCHNNTSFQNVNSNPAFVILILFILIAIIAGGSFLY